MTEIALREHLEYQIKMLDQRVNERFCARDKELVKQAHEYERRLELLNHEQARLASDRERFMPREIADQRQKDFDDWKAQVENRDAIRLARSAIMTIVLSSIISITIFTIAKFFT